MRSFVGFACAVALVGCASFPSAHLVSSPGLREELAAPVVCGPMGFRKVPLQSRWGEFVRVTVAAPSALRGSVLVHANGVTAEPHAWSTTADGALVVEARFPNLDPDVRFALERSRPIDLTITGLEAPGGTCEGAVFTVEQGELVPSIDERAWVAELERRGGPELAARREAVRREQDARRQAHYAAWAARHVEVTAEVALEMSQRREAHYAAWETARSGEASVSGGVLATTSVDEAACVSGDCSANSDCTSGACGAGATNAANCAGGACDVVASNAASCASGTCNGVVTTSVVGAVSCASGTCDSVGTTIAAGTNSCTGGTCGGVVTTSAANCASGACNSVGTTIAAGTNTCAGGTCGGVGTLNTSPCASGACDGASASSCTGACTSDLGFLAGASCSASVTTGTVVAIGAPATRAQCRGGCAAGAVFVSSPTEWAELPIDEGWAQPGAVAEWSQPFPPTLEPVVVSTETRVAVAVPQPAPAPAVVPAPTCDDDCASRAGFAVALPALFQVMVNAGALMPTMPPPGTQHAAVPAARR